MQEVREVIVAFLYIKKAIVLFKVLKDYPSRHPIYLYKIWLVHITNIYQKFWMLWGSMNNYNSVHMRILELLYGCLEIKITYMYRCWFHIFMSTLSLTSFPS